MSTCPLNGPRHNAALHAAAWALTQSDASAVLSELLDMLGLHEQRTATPQHLALQAIAATRPPLDAALYAKVRADDRKGIPLPQIAAAIGRSPTATKRILAGHLPGPLRPGQPDPRPSRARGYLADPQARAAYLLAYAPDYIAPVAMKESA